MKYEMKFQSHQESLNKQLKMIKLVKLLTIEFQFDRKKEKATKQCNFIRIRF